MDMIDLQRSDRETPEEIIRKNIFERLLKERQNVCLDNKQIKLFLNSEDLFLIPNLPLRERVLQPGEKINIYTDTQVFFAQVVSTEKCPNRRPELGFTNVFVKRI